MRLAMALMSKEEDVQNVPRTTIEIHIK